MKKGFVLMETIVVIVVISVALLTIFASYNKILSKVKTENKYDTSEYIYMTEYIKKNVCTNNANATDLASLSASSRINKKNNYMINAYGVEKVYFLTGFDSFNLSYQYFDPYMIDYIKKLDVKNDTKLLIVEYKRPVRNINDYSIKPDTKNNELYETYIASLECNNET